MTKPDAMTHGGRPFRVRKMRSGWTGAESYYVAWLQTGGRVTVHAYPSRDAAQMDADQLNIGALVRPYAEDPRPYSVRRAEAEVAYAQLPPVAVRRPRVAT